jgi:predicted nucleic acid-binding protein
MLTDTGPIVAIIDKGDDKHAECLAVMRSLPSTPILTTWSCFTEAMYLLESVGGYGYQDSLWQWRRDGRLILLDVTEDEASRMDALMAKYRNVPMDLADSSIVAVSESRDYRKVFTIDNDFYSYRLNDGSVLEVVR